MKASTKKTLLVIAVILAIGLVMMAIVITSAGIKQGAKGNHYDLNCLTEPKAKPLTECEL